MESSKTYTVKQVAKILGFSTNTVYKYLDEGRIKATRLGSEGRFRIPEDELIRLVGKNGIPAPQIEAAAPLPNGAQVPIQQSWQARAGEEKDIIAKPNSVPNSAGPNTNHSNETIVEHVGDRAEAAYGASHEKIDSIIRNIYNPDLFDWFLGLISIFLGVSFLLFPYSIQFASFEPYRQIIALINIAFIILGGTVIFLRLFVSPKLVYLHVTARIVLSVAFLAITLIYFESGQYWVMTYFGTLGIFSLVSAVPYFRSPLRLIFFVYTLLVTSAIAWAKQPTPYFIFGDIRYFVQNNPGLFEVAFTASATVVLVITVLAYFRIKSLFALLCVFVSIIMLIASFEASLTQSWNKAVILLLSGSFLLLVPFERNLDAISNYSKRYVFFGFSWLVGVILLGVGLVWFMQKNFESFVLDQQSNSVAVASETVDSFAQDSIAYMNHLAQDKDLKQRLITYKNSGREEDLASLDEQVRIMFLGSTTLRRLTLFNPDIEGISLYPPINGATSLGTNVSLEGRKFLRQARDSKKTIITTGLQPAVLPSIRAAIYVVVPVVDEEGNVLAILSGGLDFDKLYKKLVSSREGTGHFVIADRNQTILLHPDDKFVGQKTNFNNGLTLAAEGQTGRGLGYSEEGILTLESYTPVQSLGWGIVSKQPYTEAFRKTSLISFLVFLMTMFLGVGSLLATSYSIRKKI